MEEKMDIERKLYDAIKSNDDAPELWKISNMTDEEIGQKIDELDLELKNMTDEKAKEEKTTLKQDLEGLYYAKIMYPELLDKNVNTKELQTYVEGLKVKEFNILKGFYMQAKDMDTLIRLYQLNPDDPEISFEYNYTYYQYIKQYITSQPKDVIQPELEKILQAFEKVIDNTDNDEIKTEAQKVIDEIKTTLKNMMGDNN
ncbi:MAG: hypothetical protein B6I29_04315 [Marinitoga sp. 4572_148]|nr:MAG: hypothetical protein B6I29_04315 [Marinitoga sp. 4572_148]